MWAPEQARAVLAEAEGDPPAPLYGLALYSGLRQRELLGLHRADLGLDRAVLRVRRTLQRAPEGSLVEMEPKTERGRRTVALPPSVVVSLRQYRTAQLEARMRAGPRWNDTPFVFTTALGAPIGGTSVTRRFQRLVGRLGLPSARFHDLRHMAATFQLAAGASVADVASNLGHVSAYMTLKVYAHATERTKRQAVARMASLLGRGYQ